MSGYIGSFGSSGFRKDVYTDTHDIDVIDYNKKIFKETRLFEYALLRNDEGEAIGVFQVPKKPYYSIKYMKRKKPRWWRSKLVWERYDWRAFKSEELEEITQAQFESYKEFGLPEFKIKVHASPKENQLLGRTLVAGTISYYTLGILELFDVIIYWPEMILLGAAVTGVCWSWWGVIRYRSKKRGG